MIILDLFKGLTKKYYIRQMFFGVIIGILVVSIFLQGENPRYSVIIPVIINTILYPYSRFAYESIMEFILGDNIFINNLLVFIVSKLITMLLCWAAAVFIAPIGLIFIYFYQRKNNYDK